MMDSVLNKIEPRVVIFLMLSAFLLTLLAAYLYLFKPSLTMLDQHQQTLLLLESEMQTGVPLKKLNIELQQQLKTLEAKISAGDENLSKSQMIARVIAQLDSLATDNRLQLVSVAPGIASQVFMFEELPFSVEIIGSYFDIYTWLSDVNNKLGPTIVKSFEISTVGNDNLRKMNMHIVSYVVKRAS